MSTAMAIASVTAVLRDLLNNGIVDHNLAATVGNVMVTSLPPDRINTEDPNLQSRLNLFMYQAKPNQGWRNEGLPSRNRNGERLSNPPLALDLHYLLSAYGAEEFHSEILLGYGMQILHETPILTRDAIRIALAPPLPVSAGNLPPALQALAASELAEQVEQIKITPASLGTEEMSRLWTAFQSHYRPTAMYQVSVVLIESRRSTRAALPVRARNLYVIPFRHPVIAQLRAQSGVDQPIVADSTLVIAGQRLRGDVTRVRIGEIEVAPTPDEVSDTQIVVPLGPLAITSPPLTSPPLSSPALQAGVQGVQVIHQIMMGTPPVPHRGVESNVAAFVLRPVITAAGVANAQGSGAALRSADVTVHVEPAIGQSQRVVLLMNQHSSTAPAAYTFMAAARGSDTDQITIPISDVRAGNYLVRVQVDGAESPLEVEPELTSPPTAEQFTGPQVTIL